MSEDQILNRVAVEAFAVYVAKLAEQEQKAIDELKVPAKDSHTRMKLDTRISEAVRETHK